MSTEKYSRSDRHILDEYVKEHGEIPHGTGPSPETISLTRLMLRSKPGYRRGDPDVWSCLSDEHRDVINAWYSDLCEAKREDDRKEKARIQAASYLALIPFSIAYAYHTSVGEVNWRFAINAICAWAIYAFVFEISSRFFQLSDSKASTIVRTVCVALASYIILYNIYG